GDGLLDAQDKCPKEAEDKDSFQDEDGCPDPDNDKDGVLDAKDKCPNQPESKNGYQDDDGCPDEIPDQDKDGIADASDKCPDKAETKNGFQDEDGCPDELPAALKKFSGTIAGIEFETGSAKIAPKSFKVLDGAIKVLTEYKDTRVQISGHTDNVGDPEANKKLSLDRAESVKAYFIEKGIAASRIEAVGHGPDKPVADNKTKAGQAKNRRIEFKLL
ncbi:MAG: OmpA family protein, partial [Deltaproteobacteria bacterium]|nr:OmpA family protein [Deltaproteobacteria bacterium]